jgi:hypothetical protein
MHRMNRMLQTQSDTARLRTATPVSCPGILPHSAADALDNRDTENKDLVEPSWVSPKMATFSVGPPNQRVDKIGRYYPLDFIRQAFSHTPVRANCTGRMVSAEMIRRTAGWKE